MTHLYRLLTNYGGWDMSLAEIFMVQTVHLSNLAWDYSDALDDSTRNRHVLKVFPNLLEFMAAGLSPSQSLGGPEGHIIDFLDYIYSRGIYTAPVSTLLPTLRTVGTAVFWLLAIYLPLVSRYPLELLYTDFDANPFGRRVFFCKHVIIPRIAAVSGGDQPVPSCTVLRPVQVHGGRRDRLGPVLQRVR